MMSIIARSFECSTHFETTRKVDLYGYFTVKTLNQENSNFKFSMFLHRIFVNFVLIAKRFIHQYEKK